ncbi:MAG: site-2 protease family protein [Mycetocola sp.]
MIESPGILLTILAFALVIGPLVFLHELGHYLAGRWFGVKADEFAIGFGREVAGYTDRRGTRWKFGWLPLGGYVRFAGDMNPASQPTPEWLSLPAHERAHTFQAKPLWQRAIIVAAGPVTNFIIAILILAAFALAYGKPVTPPVLQTIAANSPAAAAGLQPGDTILSIDGTKIATWADATAIIRTSSGTDLDVVILRDGAETSVTLTPLLTERYAIDASGKQVTDASGKPVTEDVGFVGIASQTELVPEPPTAVLPAVGDNIGHVANMILNLPDRLVGVANAAFGPGERDPNGPISVVGVGRIAGEVASLEEIPVASKVQTMLGIVASLNVALFVFNLVPLLPLDGGHVAAALWESIRRGFAKLFKRRDPGPVDAAKLMPVTFVVVIVLGGMSALLIFADIVKPVNLFG